MGKLSRSVTMRISLENRTKAVLYAIRFFLSAVLLFAGLSKWNQPEYIQSYLPLLSWLPSVFIKTFLELLPLVELLTACAIWMKAIQRQAEWVMLVLYFLFLVLALYGNIMDWTMDCSCFGESFKTTFNAWLIVRNVCFLALSFVLISKANKNN